MGRQLPSSSHGRRLAISIIDERADSNSDQTFASLAKTNDPRDGFKDVSYLQLRRAIDWTAFFLDNVLGKPDYLRTFAWISSPTDFRYVILAFATMKTGHKVFFPSPRNSLDAQLALLRECDCEAFVRPKDIKLPVMDQIADKLPLKVVAFPDLEHLFRNVIHDEGLARYKYKRSFAEARYDPFMILHTSGSTGTPKTVAITQGYISVIDEYHDLTKLGASDFALSVIKNKRAFMPFPNFHAAALGIKLGFSVFFNCPMVNPPNLPLTAELATAIHEHANVQASFLPPVILGDILGDSKMVEVLSSIEYVCYGGSPLADHVALGLRDVSHLINCLGLTEASLLPFEATAREDCRYFHFTPQKTGLRFDPISEDQYEMVIQRSDKTATLQGIFSTFPDLVQWHTGDLYSKHPTKQNHWLYEGRMDDVVVFDNGEKLNPLTIEHIIESNPGVSAALVAGSRRSQSCVLIEPREAKHGQEANAKFLEMIWPVVQRANRETVAHGRIEESFMLVTSDEKPFPRAGKGSVQRKAAIKLYSHEINALYEDNDSVRLQLARSAMRSGFSNFQEAKRSLRQIFQDVAFSIDADDQDLFSHGLDSLQVANVTRRINVAAGQSRVLPKDIYACPTLNLLSQNLSESSTTSLNATHLTREQKMEELLNSMASDLPFNSRTPSKQTSDFTVLLTGSTGSLGSYLLDSLIHNPQVSQIICLNRDASSPSRQLELHRRRGLTTDFSLVEFLHMRHSAPYLGLGVETYRRMLGSVSHVIHNAWPVDFNVSLSSMTPQVKFVRSLVDFSAQSLHAAHIYFLSTVGVVQNYGESVVPERIMTDFSTSQPVGYAESKHVAESLLAKAAAFGVPATICRIGQIAGPVSHGNKGQWSKKEWFPSLVVSSVHMGKIPSDLGPFEDVDWLPVDKLASIIVELILSVSVLPIGREDSQNIQVHHAVNPNTASWRDAIVPAVISSLPVGKRPEPIDFASWVDMLEQKARTTRCTVDEQLSSNPAIKLIEFFRMLSGRSASEKDGRMLAKLGFNETIKDSGTLRRCEGVGGEWIGQWIRQLGFVIS